MASILAKRYICPTCGSEYIVTREGGGDVVCCGRPMVVKTAETAAPETLDLDGKSVKGLRYTCEHCGMQVLCIKEAPMEPVCCGETMKKQLFFINAVSE